MASPSIAHLLSRHSHFGRGCYQIDQIITLNPDRSAKIKLVLTLELPGLVEAGFLLPEDIDAMGIGEIEQMMEQSVDSLIRASEGVEIWSSFEKKRLSGGKIRMIGTAYVPDIAKYRLGDPNDSEFPSFKFEFSEDAEGLTHIESKVTGVSDWDPEAEQPLDLTAEDLQALRTRVADKRQ